MILVGAVLATGGLMAAWMGSFLDKEITTKNSQRGWGNPEGMSWDWLCHHALLYWPSALFFGGAILCIFCALKPSQPAIVTALRHSAHGEQQ